MKEITIPREAMGIGDVKFIAAIGAYLALGALVWMFSGPEILVWCLAFSQPAV